MSKAIAPAIGKLRDLTNKTVLVTGASAGIGQGIARRLSEAGAAVAVHYRTGRESALATVDAIRSAAGSAAAVHAEERSPERPKPQQLQRKVRQALRRLGVQGRESPPRPQKPRPAVMP